MEKSGLQNVHRIIMVDLFGSRFQKQFLSVSSRCPPNLLSLYVNYLHLCLIQHLCFNVPSFTCPFLSSYVFLQSYVPCSVRLKWMFLWIKLGKIPLLILWFLKESNPRETLNPTVSCVFCFLVHLLTPLCPFGWFKLHVIRLWCIQTIQTD